ncbi:hypothetical protein B0J17DRAFT_240292 [Rhizoctonia solani]|nr:hypothetical protein B0J17DRAFT_240292 [Rhizoctonia solani]
MGGRGSTGILSDFDLCVPHSPSSFGGPPANAANSNFTDSTEANLVVATPTISSVPSSATFSLGLVRPRQEDTLEDARDFKRRKPISQPDDETATAQAWPNTPATRPANPRTRFINVRTGTLTFMSVRVTSVPPGEKYHHSFLDDLESFFWLIFWSAAAHLDDGIQYRTASAQSTLDPLTQQGPSGIAKQKLGTLAGCHLSGIIVRKDLEKFRNSWASDPVLTEVILKFGNLAFEYHFDAIDKETVLPADAFPKVIRIFQSALSHPQGCLLTDVY